MLPKFRIEYEKQLKDVLRSLGMVDAFEVDRADFGAISPPPPQLYLSHVKQKTFIEVNEEGTEAAAATAVGVSTTSVPSLFAADRPFIYLIRERLSGVILFAGVMRDPTGG